MVPKNLLWKDTDFKKIERYNIVINFFSHFILCFIM